VACEAKSLQVGLVVERSDISAVLRDPDRGRDLVIGNGRFRLPADSAQDVARKTLQPGSDPGSGVIQLSEGIVSSLPIVLLALVSNVVFAVSGKRKTAATRAAARFVSASRHRG
jgi:hypothetical protein